MSNGRVGGNRGRGPMGASTEKAKDFKGSIGKLMKHMGQYKLQLIIVFIFAIGSTIFSVIGPTILGNVTTELANGFIDKIQGGSGINFSKIGNILLWLLGLYIVSSLFSIVQGWVMSGITQKVSFQLRKEISEKINHMPMKYFDTKTHGEVLSRVTNDVDTLSMSLNQSFTQVVTSITTIIGVVIMMLRISGSMTLIAILTLPLSLGLIGGIVKKSQKYFTAQQEYLGHVNGQVEEVYGGHTVVKVFNAENNVVEEFENI